MFSCRNFKNEFPAFLREHLVDGIIYLSAKSPEFVQYLKDYKIPFVLVGPNIQVKNAAPLLFEPIQKTRIEAPVDYMGEISKLVSNRRGELLEMNQEGGLVVAIAKLPVAALFGWSNDLRSATGGRGSSSLVDQSFERMPNELQDKTTKQIRQRKGGLLGRLRNL